MDVGDSTEIETRDLLAFLLKRISSEADPKRSLDGLLLKIKELIHKDDSTTTEASIWVASSSQLSRHHKAL